MAQAMNLGDGVVFGGDGSDSGDVLRQRPVSLASQPMAFSTHCSRTMVAEIPIMATDAGGAREAVGEGGLIVPPGDPVALVEALATLLQMRDAARRCGEHARERALKKFTEERWVNAYRARYDRLTSRVVDAETTAAPPVVADSTVCPMRPAAVAS